MCCRDIAVLLVEYFLEMDILFRVWSQDLSLTSSPLLVFPVSKGLLVIAVFKSTTQKEFLTALIFFLHRN